MAVTEDDIRRIVREEIQRAMGSHSGAGGYPPLSPTYCPTHHPRPYYPHGPWPTTCAIYPHVGGGGFAPATS